MFRRRKQCYGFAPSSLKSGGVCIKKEQKFLLFCLIVPWREIVGTANFKRDFLKVVDFVHYLREEGYDMVTFKKVRDGL